MFIHHLKGCIHLMSNSLEKIREVIVLNVALKTLGRLILILKCTGVFFYLVLLKITFLLCYKKLAGSCINYVSALIFPFC